jgi:hypothetical protein
MLIASYRDVSRKDWRWPHFRPVELACKCRGRGCRGEYWHDPEFLDALERLRARMRRPLIINSAHRCGVRNALVRGAPRSRHRKLAVDISLDKHNRHTFFRAAQALGFTGIGRGRTFIHLDRQPIPAVWTYPGAESAWET